jgi:uncharacterized protein with ATP-grasp and redox domains
VTRIRQTVERGFTILYACRYAAVKADENTKALALLAEVLGELDSVEDPQERFTQAIKGVFAGNVFDLGAPKMVEMAESGMGSGEMFKNARATLVQRPWAVDKLDELLERFSPEGGPAHKKAIVFADNAGVATQHAAKHSEDCHTGLTHST